MMRGFFVTGTDTGVGKTCVSAALLYRLQDPKPFRYWKPIQTGIEDDDDTATVRRLCGSIVDPLDEGLRLPRPLSPHLAARLSNVTISLDDLTAVGRRQAATDRWIVEGAGGILVPLNDREMIVDLILALGLPAVIVARSGLGTINHTLLSLEALRRRSIATAGIVLVGPPDQHNRAAIEHYGQVPVVGEVPWFERVTPDAVRSAALRLDPGDLLRSLISSGEA